MVQDVIEINDEIIQLYPGRSALKRQGLSRPIRFLLETNLLNPSRSHFDYGCGYGSDVRLLSEQGIQSKGWDKYHCPDAEKSAADVVTCLFILEGIHDPVTRAEALQEAWSLTQQYLVISVRDLRFRGQW